MDTFTDYLASIADQGRRDILAGVFNRISEKFPDLEAKIAWNQPMFTDHGTFIIGFSAAKHHFAISPEKASKKFPRKLRKQNAPSKLQVFHFTCLPVREHLFCLIAFCRGYLYCSAKIRATYTPLADA